MKTQMRFQKILMIVSLVVAAISFVFALVFLTGSLGEATHYIEHLGADVDDLINAADFVNASQNYVSTMVTLGIIFIVLAVFMLITSCHTRRKYYITNYIAIGLFVAFALFVFVYLLIMVSDCMDLFLNGIAWESGTGEFGFRNVADQFIPEYPMYRTDTWTFILGYIVAVIVLVDAIFVALNAVWKTLLMKGEKKLLEGNAAESASAKEVA